MLLNKFRLFEAADLEELASQSETRANARICHAAFPHGGATFRCNGIETRTMSLFSVQSDLSLEVHFAPVTHLWLGFQTQGRSRLVFERTEVDIGPECPGYVIPHAVDVRNMHIDGYTGLALQLDPEDLRRTLTSLLERDICCPVRFEQPSVSNQMFGHYIRDTVFRCAHELNLVDPRFHGRLMEEFRSLILLRLLLYLPHDHSHRLEVSSPHPSRAQLVRAEEFIAEHFSKPVDMVAIAEATGVSVRSIFRYFHQVHGESPRSYLKRIRLERARAMLADAAASRTVTEVALACGFNSLGHFARAYMKSFGEFPSDTASRR